VKYALLFLVACSTSTGAEATYTTALLRCVDKSESLAQSKACRATVDAQFGVKDGGKE
jgi:hypothetical protein